MRKTFEYKHVVGFEETNLVGNVYYAHLLSWQGRCREMFLREYVPDILDRFKNGFALVTTKVSCEFDREILAFEDIVVRMRLSDLKQNRIVMTFDYLRIDKTGEEIVARGKQEVAVMRRE